MGGFIASIILVAAFPLELLALFAIWNWRLRGRSFGWLIAGCVALPSLAVLPILLPTAQTRNIYLGFAGMYLFSGLAWAWWVEGLEPREWSSGEVSVTLMATALFAMASGG